VADTKALAKHWLQEIAGYDARQKKARWHMWARHTVDRYLLANGTGGTTNSPEEDGSESRYNIFWSNVENLKPGMYAQTPKPVVIRRQTAQRDATAKTTAEVIERVLAYQLSEHGFGSAIRAARDDYLLVGRGTPWVRYVPHIKSVPLDDLAQDESDNPPPSQEMLEYEECIVDYVHWSDFGHTDARRWEDVRALWRRVRIDKEQVTKLYGKEWAERLAYDSATVRSDDKPDTDSTPIDNDENTASGLASIYEVWDSRERQIIFVSKGQTEALNVINDDPLALPRFFPCSRPIYATLANQDLFPVSDYRQYRTQIRQIQNLTKRIDALTDAVKVVGAYDGSIPELKEIFKKPDNTLVPVTNWAALAGKGGLDGTISLIPMKEIAEVLTMLHDEREKALNDSYQLTGISDLIRGDTQASETATAQNIKNNYITMRFDEKKREVDRCVVNTLDIMASIICRQFSDKSIIEMSGMKMFQTMMEKQQCEQAIAAAQAPPQPQQPGMPPMPPAPIPSDEQMEMCDHPTWEEVIKFLRNEPERRFAVDIETDSTVASDQQAQQQHSVQFLSAVGGFLKSATDAAQTTPELVPLMGKMLEWGVRQFPIGRDLEDAIAHAVEDMEKSAQTAKDNPQQPPPDPAMMKVQQDGQIAQQTLQLKQQGQQFDQQIATQKLQADVTLRTKDLAHGHDMAQSGAQSDAANASQQNDQSIQIEAVKAQLAAQEATAKMQAERSMAEMVDQRERDKINAQIDFDRWKAELENQTKIIIAELTASTSVSTAQISAANAAVEQTESDDGKGDAMEKFHAMLTEIGKPRKIVRDANGLAQGIE